MIEIWKTFRSESPKRIGRSRPPTVMVSSTASPLVFMRIERAPPALAASAISMLASAVIRPAMPPDGLVSGSLGTTTKEPTPLMTSAVAPPGPPMVTDAAKSRMPTIVTWLPSSRVLRSTATMPLAVTAAMSPPISSCSPFSATVTSTRTNGPAGRSSTRGSTSPRSNDSMTAVGFVLMYTSALPSAVMPGMSLRLSESMLSMPATPVLVMTMAPLAPVICTTERSIATSVAATLMICSVPTVVCSNKNTPVMVWSAMTSLAGSARSVAADWARTRM